MKITFRWSPVAADYSNSAIHYNILASNCGCCPATTNHTNVTCTDVPVHVAMINKSCIFGLRTVDLCEHTLSIGPVRVRLTNSTIRDPTVTSMFKLDTGCIIILTLATLFAVLFILSTSTLMAIMVKMHQSNKVRKPTTQFGTRDEFASPSSIGINTVENIVYDHSKNV